MQKIMAALQSTSAPLGRWSSFPHCQLPALHQSSGIGYKRCIPTVVKACAQGGAVSPAKQGSIGRRQLLAGAGPFLASVFFTDITLAAQVPKGFKAFSDKSDGYSFLYPSDWRDFDFEGQDAAYKNVVKPFENVRVSIVPSDKSDVHDLGPPDEVAKHLVTKVLSAPNQRTNIFDVKERTTEDKNYYTFEYVVSSPSYTRHAFATIAIGNGKYYTLIIGANERRWKKMEEVFRTVADSLTLFDA